MDAAGAERLQVFISANFPWAVVLVTPQSDGADILVSAAGEKDRRFKIDDDYRNSPIARLLIGAAIDP